MCNIVQGVCVREQKMGVGVLKKLCSKEFLFDRDACNFIKKETLTQVFSHEFSEISKNIFSYRTPPLTASLIDKMCS